jgi:hypothetical protein
MDRSLLSDSELDALHRKESAQALVSDPRSPYGNKDHPVWALMEAHRKEWESHKSYRKVTDEHEERKTKYEENQPACEACGSPIPYTGKRGRTPKKCEECRNAA